MSATISWVIAALIVGALGGYLVARPSAPGAASMTSTNAVKLTSPLTASSTDEEKIANAMSAAPDSISKDATVLDMPATEGESFRTLRTGSNGWTCLPDMISSPSNDPICVDKMGFDWFGAYMSKQTPKIAQTGIGYMLQGASDASNVDPFATQPATGESWVTAPPHMMIFPAWKLSATAYGTDPSSGGPWVMWANTPYAHIMVPVQ